MRFLSVLAVAMTLAVPAVALAPTDFSGTWQVAGEVSGVPVNESCVLVQAADLKLTGSCSSNMGKFDVAGSVKDNQIAFAHGGTYEGNDITMTYTGKMAADGTFSGTLDVSPYDVSGGFSAKKGAPPAPAQ